MIVTSHLFEAFLECSTKCWLRARAEPTAGNAYAEWARAQNKAYCEHGVQRLLAILPESDCAIAPTISGHPKDATWHFAIDVCLRTNNLETRLQAVKRVPSAGRGKTIQFVPYRFDFANKINKNHKLLLAFDALVLAGAVGREVSLGKIIRVRRQSFWDIWRVDLREALARLVDDVMRPGADASSAGLRWSVV